MEDYGKAGSARLKHNMRAAHKYTEACCGAGQKEYKSEAKKKALEKVKTKWKRSNEVGPAYTKREAKAADKSEWKRINKYFD